MKWPLLLIAGLVLAGAVLHLLAWLELEEYHWFDIIGREAPPFEDLSPQGQLLVIASWVCAAAAVGMIVLLYVLPRFREVVG